jgi:hypothetical protein
MNAPANRAAGPTICSGTTPAHTVDLFQYQTGEAVSGATRCRARSIPELGIAMDMSIQS